MLQQRASVSAANPAIQQQHLQQSSNDEERIVASTSSPVNRMSGPRAANARDDQTQNDDDTEESASAATTATRKRKRSVSSEPKRNHLDVNRNTPVRLHVNSMIDTVRPHLLRLLEDTEQVDLWISLLHPHLDDGNNRALEVQLNAQGVVSSVEVRQRIIALLRPPGTLCICNVRRLSVCLSATLCNKMLSYRRETALQGAL